MNRPGYNNLFQVKEQENFRNLNWLIFCTWKHIKSKVNAFWNILKLSCRPLVFTSYKTSLSASFSAWFLYYLTKFHCLVVNASKMFSCMTKNSRPSKHFNVGSTLFLGWYDIATSHNDKSTLKQRSVRERWKLQCSRTLKQCCIFQR